MPRLGRHAIDEERNAGILAARQRTCGTEKARADHQAARDVVGPFDRRVEQRPQQHRADDDEEVRRQQHGCDGVGHMQQRAGDQRARAARTGCKARRGDVYA